MAHLLLIDDDPGVLDVLSEMLSTAGHTVVATPNAKKAMNLIQDNEFELVITDLFMPGIKGWDVADKVKRKHPCTPVILITGCTVTYEGDDLASRGVDLLLSKPITLKRLTRSIERLIPGPLENSLMAEGR